MKKILFMSVNFASAALLLFVSAAYSAPQCVGSDDPDGDGWGYENGISCQIATATSTAGSCIDSDGDGYGWNGVSSCRVNDPVIVTGASKPTCNFPAISDADGDGFGWENGASCIVSGTTTPVQTTSQQELFSGLLQGEWNCTHRYAWLGNYRQINSTQSSYTEIAGWNPAPQFCTIGCPFGNSNNLTFNGNQVIKESFINNVYTGTETLNWSVNNMQFTLGGQVYQKIAFENYNGAEYFHYYVDDRSRKTCKKM